MDKTARNSLTSFGFLFIIFAYILQSNILSVDCVGLRCAPNEEEEPEKLRLIVDDFLLKYEQSPNVFVLSLNNLNTSSHDHRNFSVICSSRNVISWKFDGPTVSLGLLFLAWNLHKPLHMCNKSS